MRKLLLLAVLAAGGVGGWSGTAKADGASTPQPIQIPDIHTWLGHGPKTTSVTWPSVTPPGWYSNTYRHKWYFPWYAYYNYSTGPYSNWMAGGGYAGYANHGPAGMYYSSKPPTEPYFGAWYAHTQGVIGSPIAPPTVPEPMPKKEDKPKEDKPKEKGGTVSVTLPPNAKLLFNGVAANGSGGLRRFQTPPLTPGQSYQYELTAEVVRDGRTERATGTVIVRAGETARVTLTPVPVAVITASK